jgi:hypothetical protein
MTWSRDRDYVQQLFNLLANITTPKYLLPDASMPPINPAQIIALQQNSENIRNVSSSLPITAVSALT